MKINSIIPDQDSFISRVTTIARVPKKLYYVGTLPDKDCIAVAIVGSRRPTRYGQEVTAMIASALAKKGIVIVSGMAIGVDAIAHTAALDVGGRTLAILPGGVDTPYPRSNYGLSQRIIEHGGALISEYEPGSEPRQYHFLERNRLVSALSDIVVVTEAALRSGTLSTVAHGLEQGKTIFAVPGNITSPMSAGCNQLIKQGATPLLDVQQIFDELGLDQTVQLPLALGDTTQEITLLGLLRSGVQDGDELLSQSKLTASDYSQTITMMEIKGLIRPLGGNQWCE